MGGEIHQIHEELLSLTNNVVIKCTHAPIKDAEGNITGMVGTGIDVSELLSTQERLRIKLEDLDFFNRASYHELKEPIRNIVSFSQLSEKAIKQDEQDRALKFIRPIIRNGKRMSNIVKGINRYFEPIEAEIRDVDPAVVLKELIKQNNGQSIDMVGAQAAKSFRIDLAVLRMVLSELITNSLKHQPVERLQVQLTTTKHQGYVLLEYSDFKTGIENEYSSYIFRPFKQLPPADKNVGSGLGLFFVKRSLQAIGAEISYQSGVFSFSMPIH